MVTLKINWMNKLPWLMRELKCATVSTGHFGWMLCFGAQQYINMDSMLILLFCGNFQCFFAVVGCCVSNFRCVVMAKLCFWIIALVTTVTNELTHHVVASTRNCHVTQTKKKKNVRKEANECCWCVRSYFVIWSLSALGKKKCLLFQTVTGKES